MQQTRSKLSQGERAMWPGAKAVTLAAFRRNGRPARLRDRARCRYAGDAQIDAMATAGSGW
jgi:hypothetical protein